MPDPFAVNLPDDPEASTETPATETATPPLSMLQSIQKQQQSAYDAYSAKIRAARTAAAPDTLGRLSQALLAAGRPNRWGSTMVGIQQGLENWQQSGAEARKLQAQYGAEDAELELKRKLADSDLMLKYATKTAPKAPQLEKLEVKISDTGVVQKVNPYTGAVVPDGMVVLKGGQIVPMASIPGLSGVTQEYVGGAAAGQTAAAPGVVPGQPAAAPSQAPQDGAGWQQRIGQIVAGDTLGLDPNVRYLVKVDGPEAIKGVRMVFGDDAMRLTGGRYSAGQVDENGQFTPYSDKDRMPTPEDLRTNLRGIQSAIDQVTTNYNQVQAVAARFNSLTTGMLGKGLSLVWGTEPYNVAAELKTTVSAIALDKLRELKQQSPTGASGLGSVTERELGLLEASIAPLDQAQGPDAIRAAAARVMTHYKNLLASLQQDGQRVALNLRDAAEYGRRATAAPSGAAPTLVYDPQTKSLRPAQ